MNKLAQTGHDPAASSIDYALSESSMNLSDNAMAEEGDDKTPDVQGFAMELPPGWEFDVYEGDFDHTSQRKRRSNRNPPGIPFQLIEEDRQARELLQKRKRRKGDVGAAPPAGGLKRSASTLRSGSGKQGDGTGASSDTGEEVNTTLNSNESSGRHTLTGRRLKRRRYSKLNQSDGLPDGDAESYAEDDGAEAEEEKLAAQEGEAAQTEIKEEDDEPELPDRESDTKSAAADDGSEGSTGETKEEAAALEADSGEDTLQAHDDSSNSGHAEDEEEEEEEEGERGEAEEEDDDDEESFMLNKPKKQPKEGKRRFSKKNRSFDDRREHWDQLWEEKFQELVKWRNEKGACSVGKNDNNKTLAWWIHEQRRKKRHGTLSDYRLEKLNSIGFVWSVEGEGRGGHRRRRKKEEAKEDSDEYKPDHAAKEPSQPGSEDMQADVPVLPVPAIKGAKGKGAKATRGKGKNGRGGRARSGSGRAAASAATAAIKKEQEEGEAEEKFSNEEEQLTSKRKGKGNITKTTRAGTSIKESRQPTQEKQTETATPSPAPKVFSYHLHQPTPALPSFYDLFLRREDERRRDKEAMEAMMARIQKEREKDKKRISRLEEIVRTLTAGHPNRHTRIGATNNGFTVTPAAGTDRMTNVRVSPLAEGGGPPPPNLSSSSTPSSAYTASHPFVTNGFDLGLSAHLPAPHPSYPASHPTVPIPHHTGAPPHLPSPVPLHSTTLPSMIPTAVDPIAWKREPRQELQQRGKETQAPSESNAKACNEVEQLMEESKILPNVEELEIEQFFM